MCGIFGHLGNKIREKDEYSFMLKLLRHRGPDASNLYYNKKNNVVLGHTRLSIIDLNHNANQPMQIDHLIIVFNGEIYNFLELKNKYLEDIEFISNSDTEVILRLYAKYGIDKTLKLLRGMFAFAIYDRNSDLLYLARDQVGKKPLYYNYSNNSIFFSSDIKPYTVLKENLEINENIFDETNSFRFSSTNSVTKDLEMLKNGTYLSFNLKNNQIIKKNYFHFSDLIDEKLYNQFKNMSEDELIDRLNSVIIESIRRRFIADVPIATINSGGIDSSLVTAIAYNLKKMDILHVNVEGMSETKFAKILTEQLKAEMKTIKLNSSKVDEYMDETIQSYEYPLVHPNSIGIKLVSKLARENYIKVLLCGDGADELFGGYGFQLKYYILNKIPLLNIPNIFKKIYKIELSTYMKSINKKISNIVKNTLVIQMIKENQNNYEKNFDFIANVGEKRTSAFMLGVLDEYLQPILLRADKMSMAHSVEMRSPFLDLELIKFAVNLPNKYKFKFFQRKYILKKVAERYLPQSIIYRKKMGFPIPSSSKLMPDKSIDLGINYNLYSKEVLKKFFNIN